MILRSAAIFAQRPTFSKEALAAFAKYPDALPTWFKRIFAEFIDGQVLVGNWPKLTCFQLRAINTAANALIDATGNVNATNNGGVHTPYYGFTYNGTTQYVNTGYILNTHGNRVAQGFGLQTLTDTFGGWFVKKNLTAGTGAFLGGVHDTVASRKWSLGQTSGAVLRVNANTSRTYTGLSTLKINGGTTWSMFRNSARSGLYINGSPLYSVLASSEPATALPQLAIYEGTLNNQGVAFATGLNADIGAFWQGQLSGFNQTAFHIGLTNMLLKIEQQGGIGSYPTWAQVVVPIGGQSNGLGKASTTPSTTALQDPMPGVYMRSSGNNYLVLDYPTTNRGDVWGLELTLGQQLKTLFTGDIYLNKVTVDGAPIAQEEGRQDFNVNSNDLYITLRDSLRDLVDKCYTLEKCAFNVMPWIQGERDAGFTSYANSYLANMNAIADKLTLDGAPVHHWIMNLINPALTSVGLTAPNITAVRNAQIAFAAARRNATIFDMAPYTLDPGNPAHYYGAQYELIGTAIANLIKSVVFP